VILHVVLFTPRADVTDAERQRLSQSLDLALTSIPSVRGFRVGRRVRTGAAYDDLPGDFEFCAVIEFDDRVGLQSYHHHPTHAELGRLFYEIARNAFAGDFDAVDRAPALALSRWQAESR
jgi:hypothetical protein